MKEESEDPRISESPEEREKDLKKLKELLRGPPDNGRVEDGAYGIESQVGGLYAELFWDDEVDRIFFEKLPAKRNELNRFLKEAISMSENLEEADQRKLMVYRDVLDLSLQNDLRKGRFNTGTYELAKAIKSELTVKGAYKPVIGRLIKSGNIKQAQEIAGYLGLKIEVYHRA